MKTKNRALQHRINRMAGQMEALAASLRGQGSYKDIAVQSKAIMVAAMEINILVRFHDVLRKLT